MASQMLPMLVATALLALSIGCEAAAGLRAQIYTDEGVPYMELAIGTPPLNITLMVDTGSFLVWTQCKPCKRCRPQPLPIFDPSASSTFSRLPCGSRQCKRLGSFAAPCTGKHNCTYEYGYGKFGDVGTRGALSTETFTIGASTFPGIVFGCADDNDNAFNAGCGFAGFGWRPLSLPAQLGMDKFSYCMPFPVEMKKGTLFLGSEAVLEGKAARTTALIKQPLSTHYYLSWKGITVGDTRLSIPSEPFDFNEENGIGTIFIDSGGISALTERIFNVVEEAFVSRVKLPRKNNGLTPLCFEMPPGSSPKTLGVPKLVFHFEGADWEFPLGNYMDVTSENTMCLLFMKTLYETSVLGMIQQFGAHVLYDLGKKQLSFATGVSC